MEPRRSSTVATAVMSTLIVAFGVVVWAGRIFVPRGEPVAELRIMPPGVELPATNLPIDWSAWRKKAWNKIEPRIAEADAADRAALETQLATVDAFFYERRPGTKAFAEAVLSFKGKWVFVKSKLPTAEDGDHLKFLQEKFEQNIFTIDELKKLIESAIGGYVSRVQGIENRLLVDVRADLSEHELAVAGAPLLNVPEAEFRNRFDTLLHNVATSIAHDSQFAASREVVSFVAGEVAAQVAVRVATAVATRLGISAGILGGGAAAGWATFGVGLVAAVVIDAAIDKVTRAAGYDPVAKVATKVDEVLGQVRTMIIDGDPEALEKLAQLRVMAVEDPVAEVRQAARESVESIEAGGSLGLRRELSNLHEARSELRREALRRLIFETNGEVQ